MRYSDFLAGEGIKGYFHDPFHIMPTPVKDGILPTEAIELDEGQRHEIPLDKLPGEVAARLSDRLDAVAIMRVEGRYALDVQASADFFNALPVADFDWSISDVCAYRDTRLHLIDAVVQRHVPGALSETFSGTKIGYRQIILVHTSVSYAQIIERLDVGNGLHVVNDSARLRREIETLLQTHDATELTATGELDIGQQQEFARQYIGSLLDSLADASWNNGMSNADGDWTEPYMTDSNRRRVIALAKDFYAAHRGDITTNDGAHCVEVAQGLAFRHSFEGEPLIGRTLNEATIFRRIAVVADVHFPAYRIAGDGEVQIMERSYV
ncbi:hypothetical protein GCM10009720_21310 [Yaniella flava]|uniref:Uncharacterized protein n=1 Tax=Yaniella flava TaxID=287930 RepID=A0ABN2UNQ2_9MICC